ncbi:MAG: cysteine desulfurase [Lachnospiraceae bacterium]|nr:cysteine desulfurase [Ruminococcus sp.]MCM1275776.1 cysteine desulfurase [Lachnospiraceae bacterium]
MITNNFGYSGIPSETELETLANELFTDIDGSLFQPDVCADGIQRLVTTGDTGIIDTAANKAFSALGASDYENILGELGAELNKGLNFDGLSGANAEFPAFEDMGGAFRELEDQTAQYAYAEPERTKTAAFSPSVISQSQADNDSGINVRTTANDNNVIPKKDSGGVSYETVGGQKNNTKIVVGTKTLEQIRGDFPILREKVNGNPLIWLDNGATTQRPQAVIDRLSYYYEHENSNVHRGAHTLAARSTDAYEKARQTVADFIGAPSKDNIVFVRGTTEGINLVAQSYVKPLLEPGDEIILSLLEHHANIVPWQLVAQETGAVIKVIPVDESGQLLLPEYEKLFTKRTKFVSVTHVSNVLGTITPVAELIAIAHRHGVRILIDGAQSVAHIPVNVSTLDADWFVFSGHKIYAPTGIGAVYGKKDVLESAKPYHGGGNMIKDVTFERTVYNPAPNKFEAGTGSIADAVGLGAALEYLNGIGMPAVSAYEHELVSYGMRELGRINGLHLIGTAPEKSSALSFVIDGVPNDTVGQILDQYGIAVRVGHHCAQPILRHYGLEGVVRPTLALYNTFEDIDALVRALKTI